MKNIELLPKLATCFTAVKWWSRIVLFDTAIVVNSNLCWETVCKIFLWQCPKHEWYVRSWRTWESQKTKAQNFAASIETVEGRYQSLVINAWSEPNPNNVTNDDIFDASHAVLEICLSRRRLSARGRLFWNDIALFQWWLSSMVIRMAVLNAITTGTK